MNWAPKVIVIATLVLFGHLIDIRSTEMEIGGLHIDLADSAILRGALAIVYLHIWASSMHVGALTDHASMHAKALKRLRVRNFVRMSRSLPTGEARKLTIKFCTALATIGFNAHMALLQIVTWTAVFFAIFDAASFLGLIGRRFLFGH
ncbi:hypothetical protein JMG10_35080 [Nostoc ellipsosporum NOK]|uniref:hypothetical protein n=1 Tax=Sphingomonas sp. IBVSS2 TaxID=1985172 RepID=UPI000A2D084E|nr:hypothetical protein [Sphingomonas sp. IBVSS2]MDF2386739.1 hypothetical protein [Nostoc ellipsosporum NOK]OSZ68314.1 hypothetical protein CAP40_06885 [Sphingomonas sp. IBVSS2]